MQPDKYEPTVLSLFSGVGGFDLGLERGGMRTVYQCEWDKHATNILNRHWPDVPKWGDVSTLTADTILAHTDTVDVVAWGSPCQDLSVASPPLNANASWVGPTTGRQDKPTATATNNAATVSHPPSPSGSHNTSRRCSEQGASPAGERR